MIINDVAAPIGNNPGNLYNVAIVKIVNQAKPPKKKPFTRMLALWIPLIHHAKTPPNAACITMTTNSDNNHCHSPFGLWLIARIAAKSERVNRLTFKTRMPNVNVA